MTTWEKSEGVLDEDVELEDSLKQRSGGLYDVLCQYCGGEALMIVKSVDDMQGFRA